MTTTQHHPTTTTWTIDPSHSALEFAVRHMMITTVKGRFSDVQGTVVLDEQDVTRSRVDVVIETGSIDTRDERRDAHLRSADFFDVEKHPHMTFVGRRVERAAGDGLRLVGDLTIRGTTREIALEVEDLGRGRDPWGGERASFTATGRLDRTEYGLEWNQALETGGLLVSNDVRITLDVQLVRSDS
jgi:polyisoprenoid-binding protein YceI